MRPCSCTGDAAINWWVAEKAGTPSLVLTPASSAEWERAFAGADWIVDALLGTGAIGPPHGGIATAIEAINSAGRPRHSGWATSTCSISACRSGC